MKLIWAVCRQAYLHFFAVIGALSLASLIASLDLFDWSSSILQMIAWWKSIAYPVVEMAFKPILSWISRILEIEIQMSDAVKDYLGVGIALAFSRLRGALFGWKKPISAAEAPPKADKIKVLKSLLRKPFLALQILIRTIFIWPVEVILMIRLALFARRIFPEETDEYIRNVQISHAITLLPIFYFVLLVLASWVIGTYNYIARK